MQIRNFDIFKQPYIQESVEDNKQKKQLSSFS